MKRDAARSAGWTLIEASSAQTILLATFLVLARLVAPADYGLMALSTAVLSVPQFILSNGVIPVVINLRTLRDEDLSTAFWTSLGIGAALTSLVLICSSPLAWLFRNPELSPVLRWSAVSFLFMALGNVPTALYQRRFEYRVFAIRSAVSFAGGGAAGIVLALYGWGVWSLVGNLLVQSAIAGTIVWAGLGWRPQVRFSRESFSAMRHNIGHTIAGNFLASFTTRLDTLILGAFAPGLLGYYYFVQRLLLTISVGTYVPIGNVLQPVLTRNREDNASLRESFAFMLWTACVLWMPIVAGLGAVAPVLVPSLFGPSWTPAIPLLQIISLTAFTTCLYQFTYPVLLAMGRAKSYPRLTLAQLVITAALLAIGTQFGLEAVGWAFVVSSLLTAMLHIAVIRSVLRTSAFALLGRLSSVALATAVMALLVFWLGAHMPGASAWFVLPIQVAAGGVVFAGALFVLARTDANRLLSAALALALPTRFQSREAVP